MKPGRNLIPSLFLILSIMFPALSWAWQGKTVGISDGDTITVMHDGKAEKIRLYGIDCPEGHQDYGTKAKEFTSSMSFGKLVEVKPMDTDRYGRTVALVTIDGRSLNEELIKAGLAWVFTKFCEESFCSRWKEHEEQARSKKVGLWSIPNPTPPWEYRHQSKKGNVSTETKDEGNQSVQSDPKARANLSVSLL